MTSDEATRRSRRWAPALVAASILALGALGAGISLAQTGGHANPEAKPPCPTSTASPTRSAIPTEEPTTAEPSDGPSAVPSDDSDISSQRHKPKPCRPQPCPTGKPSSSPSDEPTAGPSDEPTASPSDEPTDVSSQHRKPGGKPCSPLPCPSGKPTATASPSEQPSDISRKAGPHGSPSGEPSCSPSRS
jgi:hypothetical protein